MTPLNVADNAMQIAMDLKSNYPPGQRTQKLQQLKAQNEQLYAAVKQKMEEITSAGESAGRANAVNVVSGGGM